MKTSKDIQVGDNIGSITITKKVIEKHYEKTATFFYGQCNGCGSDKRITSSHASMILNGRGSGCRCNTRSTDANPEYKWRYQSYMQAAKKRNLSWKIDYNHFLDIIKKNCYYCNSEPEMRPSHHKRWDFKFPMSGIDRMDSSRGYEIDNVVPCCSYCNQAKWDHDIKDFLDWIKKVYSFQFQEDKQA